MSCGKTAAFTPDFSGAIWPWRTPRFEHAGSLAVGARSVAATFFVFQLNDLCRQQAARRLDAMPGLSMFVPTSRFLQ
jgi:hypothetical protein